MGWNLGERIACWYHGVEVDGSGVVQDVPAVSACPLVGSQCLHSYPVQERHGAIFLYFALDPKAEVPPLRLPEELRPPPCSTFLF